MNSHLATYFVHSREVLATAEAVVDAFLSDSESRDEEIDMTVEELKQAIARSAPPVLPQKGFAGRANTSLQQALTIDEELTIAATDAAIANVLFIASDAIGERGPAGNPHSLRLAIALANAELDRLQLPAPYRKGFSGSDQSQFSSTTIEEAMGSFQSQVRQSVEKILNVTDNAVSKIFEKLAEQKDKMFEAFAQIGELFSATSNNSVLVRTAWEKLRSALETINEIVDSKSSKQAEYLRDLLDAISVRGALQEIFQTESLDDQLKALHLPASFSTSQLDRHRTEVAMLEDRFGKTVDNIRSITAIAAPLLSLSVVHFAAPFAALAVPACYALSLIAIAVLGFDYTHTGQLNSGVGVRGILDGLQPQTPNA